VILRLAALPDSLRGPDDAAYHGRVPKRARFLEPSAARSLIALAAAHPWLTMTDVYRSPEASLAAMRTKRGVQQPGYSGHNYGESIDLDVAVCLQAGQLSYAALLELMAGSGWYCHRRDGGTGSEAWHFNHLAADAERLLALAYAPDVATWAKPLEQRLQDRYAGAWVYGTEELQRQLARLWLYRGEVDDSLGPLTRESVYAFQRAWRLPEDGLAGPRTRRVLALVAATIELVTT
jgi:hypothetical protein